MEMRTTGKAGFDGYTQAVEAARTGDQEAFRFLYESTYRDKWYIARKYMRNEDDAQDVLQESYLKAWKNLSSLQEPEKFSGWLSLIVANTALNALKKKKDLPFSALEHETEEGDSLAFEEEDFRTEFRPEHAYTDKETSELLKEMLDALSEEQRFCMLMYYVEERSVSEIAETIGCAKGTVTSRLNYGRKNLKAKAEELEKRGYSLYGLTALPFVRMLVGAEKTTQASSEEIPAIDTKEAAIQQSGTAKGAMQYKAEPAEGIPGGVSSADVATSSASAAAGATGMALGVKIAIGLLALAVLGGGGYAVVRAINGAGGASAEENLIAGANDSQEDVVIPLPGDDGDGGAGDGAEDQLVNPVFDQLEPEVQEFFLTQIAWAEEDPQNRSWSWVYFDNDAFPELLIRHMDWREDAHTGYLYYGTTAEQLTDIDDGYVMTLPETNTGGDALYYVPEEGVFLHEQYVDEGITFGGVVPDLDSFRASGVYFMTEPGFIKFQYNLFRSAEGAEEDHYYMMPAGGGIENLVILSREEYEELHYDGEKVAFFP